MRLLLPERNTEITLENDWVFELSYGWQNRDAWEKFVGSKRPDQNTLQLGLATVPAGTILKVSGMELRKNLQGNSYANFVIVGNTPNKGITISATFAECSKMEVDDLIEAKTLPVVDWGWGHTRRKVNAVHSYNYHDNDPRPAQIEEIIKASVNGEQDIMYAKLEIGLKWEPGGRYGYSSRVSSGSGWRGIITSMKFTLMTKGDVEHGSWGSMGSIRKHGMNLAKTIAKKQKDKWLQEN